MTPNDIELSLEEGEEDSMKTYFISVRPYAISFLKHMSELYEIVAFTASLRSYADSVLDELDPDRSLIRHRVYRDSCTKLPKKLYGKDLRVLGCNLKDVVLVDNSPYSCIFQLDNAVPILSYTASEDQELLGLEKYLRQLAGWHDIRECNRRTFKLSEYTTFSDPFDLISQLYLTADFSHLKGAGWNRFRGK